MASDPTAAAPPDYQYAPMAELCAVLDELAPRRLHRFAGSARGGPLRPSEQTGAVRTASFGRIDYIAPGLAYWLPVTVRTELCVAYAVTSVADRPYREHYVVEVACPTITRLCGARGRGEDALALRDRALSILGRGDPDPAPPGRTASAGRGP
ncbi:MAG: hypothetical protein LBK95_10690 [Bifidobacteriaceae bacterium]|nr:hypothetical protein [Bifidobacteriaceae bacterium]